MSHRRLYRVLSALLVFPLIGLAGCTQVQGGAQGGVLEPGYRIVTTCGMVTDIVRQIVGDRAVVEGLMGEGVDPHLYKPTRHDVRQLLGADVVIYSGLHLEGRMVETLERAGQQGKPVLAATDGVDRNRLRQPPEFAGHDDPHVWMDPQAWSECVGYLAEQLAAIDPAGAETYRQNAAAYRQELQRLHNYARKVIGSIPQDQRFLVTAHDAFGYFSVAFDIPVRSIQGISTDSEAGVEDVNRLIEFLVSKKVPAIFVESSVSDRNVQAVIEGAQQRGSEVVIGGQLYSDAMGAAGTYEGTYFGMIDHNATVIARALGGAAPKRGMDGKLTAKP
jgi:manganese/zinc/iron transport system substrate-binding protein